MRSIHWTERARNDLASIQAFIGQDSPHYAEVVVTRLIGAVGYISDFPESGRMVPEFADPSVREVISRPYRIVYRLLGEDDVHILTVHHGAQSFPSHP